MLLSVCVVGRRPFELSQLWLHTV